MQPTKKLLYQSLEPSIFEFFIFTTPLLEYGGHSLTSKARQAHFPLYFCLKMAQNLRLSRICKLACSRFARGDLGSPLLHRWALTHPPLTRRPCSLAPQATTSENFSTQQKWKNAFTLYSHWLMICKKEIFCYKLCLEFLRVSINKNRSISFDSS